MAQPRKKQEVLAKLLKFVQNSDPSDTSSVPTPFVTDLEQTDSVSPRVNSRTQGTVRLPQESDSVFDSSMNICTPQMRVHKAHSSGPPSTSKAKVRGLLVRHMAGQMVSQEKSERGKVVGTNALGLTPTPSKIAPMRYLEDKTQSETTTPQDSAMAASTCVVQSAPDLFPWETLEMVGLIGRGAFSKIIQVRHQTTGRMYALKSIRKGVSVTPKHNNTHPEASVDMREIGIMKKVCSSGHPSLVSLLRVYKSRRHVYLLTELCSGGDLFSAVSQRGPFPEPVARSIVHQVLLGLGHMHSLGIVHRDVKPENIMLLNCIFGLSNTTLIHSGVQVKICDFGLSKDLGNSGQKELTTRVGTQVYLAPEIMARRPYDYAVDLWGLGLLAFIVMGGYHPFDEYGECDPTAIWERSSRCEWSFNDATWQYASQEAKDFISRLLVQDPAQRHTVQQCLEHPWMKMAAVSKRRPSGMVELSQQPSPSTPGSNSSQ